MAAARATTIDDLPDDMLLQIFGLAFEGEVDEVNGPTVVNATSPAEGIHLTLRSVCRRWSDIADMTRLDTAGKVKIYTEAVAGHARGPFKPAQIEEVVVDALYVTDDEDEISHHVHTLGAADVLATLAADGAPLSRSLQFLKAELCCAGSVAATIAPIVACTALTKLWLRWFNHRDAEVELSMNALTPLSSLVSLKELMLTYEGDSEYHLALSAWPALPEVSGLTYLDLKSCTHFVPVGSAAALARLRRLDLVQWNPTMQACEQADPFYLRAAFDAGVWQPHLLQGLRQLNIFINLFDNTDELVNPPARRSSVGDEWAPLATHVTDLYIEGDFDGSEQPNLSTGLIAGLGALTALRSLHVIMDHCNRAPWLLIDTTRLRAPHLTFFYVNCAVQRLDLAAFPELVHVYALAIERAHSPLVLRSLAGRQRLAHLTIGRVRSDNQGTPNGTNLAELFHRGGGLPALHTLHIDNLKLTWRTTDLANVPTAEEFAARARELLPSLVDVAIEEAGPLAANPPQSEAACRRHVVPALRALAA